MNINKIDYKILKFIYDKNVIHIDSIYNQFPDSIYNTEYKMGNFKKCHFIQVIFDNEATGLSLPTKYYSLTPLGIETINNYLFTRKNNLKNTLFSNIIPILISILALLKSYQKELISLWKHIMQLLK